ncbi:MAG: hypothetical protein SGPRY_001941, partial [Prymnesium sp.]
VLSTFFNWLSERLEYFEEDLKFATTSFHELCAQLGEEELKEPQEFFELLEKFLTRFEAACKEARAPMGRGEEERL